MSWIYTILGCVLAMDNFNKYWFCRSQTNQSHQKSKSILWLSYGEVLHLRPFQTAPRRYMQLLFIFCDMVSYRYDHLSVGYNVWNMAAIVSRSQRLNASILSCTDRDLIYQSSQNINQFIKALQNPTCHHFSEVLWQIPIPSQPNGSRLSFGNTR